MTIERNGNAPAPGNTYAIHMNERIVYATCADRNSEEKSGEGGIGHFLSIAHSDDGSKYDASHPDTFADGKTHQKSVKYNTKHSLEYGNKNHINLKLPEKRLDDAVEDEPRYPKRIRTSVSSYSEFAYHKKERGEHFSTQGESSVENHTRSIMGLARYSLRTRQPMNFKESDEEKIEDSENERMEVKKRSDDKEVKQVSTDKKDVELLKLRSDKKEVKLDQSAGDDNENLGMKDSSHLKYCRITRSTKITLESEVPGPPKITGGNHTTSEDTPTGSTTDQNSASLLENSAASDIVPKLKEVSAVAGLASAVVGSASDSVVTEMKSKRRKKSVKYAYSKSKPKMKTKLAVKSNIELWWERQVALKQRINCSNESEVGKLEQRVAKVEVHSEAKADVLGSAATMSEENKADVRKEENVVGTKREVKMDTVLRPRKRRNYKDFLRSNAPMGQRAHLKMIKEQAAVARKRVKGRVIAEAKTRVGVSRMSSRIGEATVARKRVEEVFKKGVEDTEVKNWKHKLCTTKEYHKFSNESALCSEYKKIFWQDPSLTSDEEEEIPRSSDSGDDDGGETEFVEDEVPWIRLGHSEKIYANVDEHHHTSVEVSMKKYAAEREAISQFHEQEKFKEKRGRKWDDQRRRELCTNERLKKRYKRADETDGDDGHLMDIADVEEIIVTEELPVICFGSVLPKLKAWGEPFDVNIDQRGKVITKEMRKSECEDPAKICFPTCVTKMTTPIPDAISEHGLSVKGRLIRKKAKEGSLLQRTTFLKNKLKKFKGKGGRRVVVGNIQPNNLRSRFSHRKRFFR